MQDWVSEKNEENNVLQHSTHTIEKEKQPE